LFPDRIENVFDPRRENSSLSLRSMHFTAVIIPTKAVIPIAIIDTVNVARSFWLLTEPTAVLRFSLKDVDKRRSIKQK